MKEFPLKEVIFSIVLIGTFIIINFPFSTSLGMMGLALSIIVLEDLPINQTTAWALFSLSLSVAWWTFWEGFCLWVLLDNFKVLIRKLKVSKTE